MSIHVIASNETLLGTLRSSLQQHALPLASAVLRPPGPSLLQQLQNLTWPLWRHGCGSAPS
jgi:hypothetical protein